MYDKGPAYRPRAGAARRGLAKHRGCLFQPWLSQKSLNTKRTLHNKKKLGKYNKTIYA